MIELDLEKTLGCVLYHLKVLAAVRMMCKDHDLPVDWCLKWEQEVAETAGDIRMVIEARGSILQIK